MKTTFTINPTFIRVLWATLLFALFITTPMAFAQSVTILPSGITPNQSGAVPRLSYEAIMALPNPQDGDTAYDVTFHCMRLYKKDKWVKMLSDDDLVNPSVIGWQIGGAKSDFSNAIDTDASGNVYVAGAFQESAKFENTDITGNGPNTFTAFVAKFTNTGHLVWVQKIGYIEVGAGSFSILKLMLDTNGNLFMTGSFNGTITLGANTYTSAGASDIFVAKCNSSGILQWVKQGGGTGNDDGQSLGVDGNGNVYITGKIDGNVTFAGTPYIGSSKDMYTAKFGGDGTFKWLRRVNGDASPTNMAVNASGKVVATGYFDEIISFSGTQLTSAGGLDAFLVQYDTDGNLEWARRMGGTSGDFGIDVAFDSESNITVLGYFDGTAKFDIYSLVSAGAQDIFIAQYSSTGTIRWFKRDGGAYAEHAQALAVDAADNIYITGDFQAPSTFGNVTLISKGGANRFVAKYNKTADFQWAKAMGGTGQATILKMAADTKGNLFGVAYFSFGFTADDNTFTSRGSNDILILRIKD